ncbi:anti-sigma factor RsbA family regulatory protein [Modestobacter versicolor]|uniref:Anti-sigma regulatory factor (Ser/Thr protein kinase) n=1 Tax=Modestobacter versicolor TaxID=429133 RepID=A0A323V2N5_9ACTN|nr:anti-sigma factor RsbA family regulatory protein [Modestobacter versicolor]MBB3677150.1 anti-sigma regulatory factor (Ser/Thr protein kinase) [Modestobacter versicolor]PZA19017.1 sensor histidine kinase [Modestobacter versicolor]
MDGAAGSGTHRALIGSSDEDLVDGTVAFVCAGLDAGEPVVVAVTEPTGELLQKALADRPQVVWADWADVYGNGPAAAITAVRRLGERHRTPASPVVHVVLEPFAGPDQDTWREWQRYDAVLDHQLDEAEQLGVEPLVVLCVCDTRRVPALLVDAVRATHPLLQVDGHAQPNPGHVDAAEYLTTLPVPAEPLEATEPLMRADAVRDLRGLRRDLASQAGGASLPPGSEPALEDFLLAVDEMTTNALRHGRPPVDLRLWAGQDRLVCTVTDRGAGLQDPFIGYGPAHGDDLSLGGMGLWLARQLCDHVDITLTDDGVQVRLTTVLR